MDVIGHPSPCGLAYRRDQLERDRLRLLAKLEAEQLVPITEADRVVRVRLVSRLPLPPRPVS